MQRDLFRSEFHAVFVKRDGSRADVLQFADKHEMRRVALYKMRKDLEGPHPTYAYAHLNWWNGQKVQGLETLYGLEKDK